MRVLAISGSVRRASYSTKLLRTLRELSYPGMEVELYNALKLVPPYSEDDDGPSAPQVVRMLRSLVQQADAVVFATPEYNGSVPGQLKNAIDWLSRPFAENALRNKVAGVVSVSSGQYGGVWAQQDLKKILGIAGARVVPEMLAVPRVADQFDDGDQLTNSAVEAQLHQLLHALGREVAGPGADVAQAKTALAG